MFTLSPTSPAAVASFSHRPGIGAGTKRKDERGKWRGQEKKKKAKKSNGEGAGHTGRRREDSRAGGKSPSSEPDQWSHQSRPSRRDFPGG